MSQPFLISIVYFFTVYDHATFERIIYDKQRTIKTQHFTLKTFYGQIYRSFCTSVLKPRHQPHACGCCL